MSNIIKLTDDELKKIKKFPEIGRGTYGTVYIYNGMAFKLYYDKLNDENIYNLKSLANYEIDNIIFPKMLVKNNNDYIGIIEDKVNGIPLFELCFNIINDTFDIDINSFYKLCESTIIDIRKVSKEKIIMNDIHDENIMYDGLFKFIDTDQYLFAKNDSYNNIYNYNLSCFIKTIQNMFEMLNSKVCFNIAKNSNFIYDEKYIDNLFNNVYKILDKNFNYEGYCYSLKNLKNYRG